MTPKLVTSFKAAKDTTTLTEHIKMADTLISNDSLDREINNNYHFGHILLEHLRKRRPDNICQIDAATGDQETYHSVLTRSVKLARSLRNYGLKPGDVLILAGKNHIDLRIPYYAGLFNGLPVAGVDPLYKYAEVKTMLHIAKPKIAFCDYNSYELYKQTAQDLNLDFKIVTFKEGECTFEKFIETYDDGASINEFEAANFNTEKVYAWLPCTSGTTENFKLVATTHGAIVDTMKFLKNRGFFGRTCESGQKVGLVLAPPHWLGAYVLPLGFVLRNTVILQSSKSDSIQHYIDAINKYKPSLTLISPSILGLILNNEKIADFTCFDTILIGGSKMYTEIKTQIQSLVREDAEVVELYGQTEVIGPSNCTVPGTPIGSCGPPVPRRLLKLVHPDTDEEILEPNKPGELLYKGPRFTEYYNNHEETAKAITPDGWFRTGDLLYRDEKNNYYFVERLKMLIKWRLHHVLPTEIEDVIIKHPGVLEVCVTSLEHALDGEWPIACVVRRPGSTVTAQEIQALVTDNFAEYKQLHGGVVFMDELPKTSNGKIARIILRGLVRSMKK